MSVVIWDGKILACEGHRVDDNVIVSDQTIKIHFPTSSPYKIVGCVGNGYASAAFRDILDDWRNWDIGKSLAGDRTLEDATWRKISEAVKHPMDAILIDEYNNAWIWGDGAIKPIPASKTQLQEKAIVAIGAGKEMAYGALHAGATACQAARICSQFHRNCNGVIHYWDSSDPDGDIALYIGKGSSLIGE